MYHTFDLNFLGTQDTIACFLVETSAGLVLIESGPHSTITILEKHLQSINYELKDIKYVLLSHIHFDHAGAAWAFAELGATVYVHPVGVRHLAAPDKLYNSAKMIYGDKMEMLWGEMRAIPEAQLYAAAHGEEIVIGDTSFSAWHTPGHASHHIAWQMGQTLFAGDVAGVKIANGIVTPPCPPPDIHIEDWQNSISLMKSLEINELALTHFGKISDVHAHLDALETMILAWANWMRPHYETGKKVEEIVPDFKKYVTKQLMDTGISAADAAKYENANPAFMSVAGLMRYWHKKLSI